MDTNKKNPKGTENGKQEENMKGNVWRNNNEAEIDQNPNSSSDKFEK